MRTAARSVVWLALLVASLLGVHDLDLSAVGAPGLADGPEAAAALVVRLVRIVALGLGWYLVAATVVTLATHTVPWPPRAGAVGPTRRLVPCAVDELVRGVCGLTLALTTTAAPAMAAAAPGRETTITMRRLHGEAPAPDERAPITMRRVEPAPPPAPAGAPQAPAQVPPVSATHVIAAGEHLWAVAASTLATAWATPPTDAEIDPYWRALVEQNRQRLPDPANPDLVHPGAVIVLPPLPPRDV